MRAPLVRSLFWINVFLLAAVPAAAQRGAPAVDDRDLWAVVHPGASIARTGGGARSVGCSASTCLQQATLNSAGLPAATATTSYALNASLGQEMTVGCSSSPHYVVQSGFWGRYGSTLVPVVLMVTKDPADEDWPKLDWSGNNAPYAVYRATACALIFDGLYDSTGDKTYTDEAPPAADLTCYNILATAPGRHGEGLSPELNGAVRVPTTLR